MSRLVSLCPSVVIALGLLTGAHTAPTRELRRTQSAATIAPAARRDGWDTRARLSTDASGTYIDELLAQDDSSLTRWPDRRVHPLRIWLRPAFDVRGWRPSLEPRVRSAFREWEALGIPVSFAFISDSASADVHVSWVEQFREPISGKTVWAHTEDGWIVDADITIAVHHSSGVILDETAIKAIALHEVGHLLGLDHTADSTNIMAARVRVRELSTADRATMQLLYELPPGRVR